ncbi:MAG: hypothetical protein RLZZ360_22 [Candidatus Parcubacteria bacterium]|jgi:hypothetical protein
MTQKWNLQDIRPTEPRRPRSDSRPVIINRPTSNESTSVPTRHGDVRTTPNVGVDMRMPQRERDSLPPSTPSSFAPEDVDTTYDEIPVINGKKKSRHHLIIASALFLGITGLGIFISYLTGGATVTYHPKVKELNVNATFTAYKEEKSEELSYEILTLEATSERQVEASGQEEVKVQATGEIEITKITPGAERLIKNTRFETLDGLVFRIEESVVVPGAVTVDGKSVPGTIRAKVFADEAGDKYNLKAGTDMKVPGFKEGNYMDLYNAISAKNTAAFTNGFAGPKFIINEDALATARQSLQAELRDTLLARVESERPAGYTTFKDSVAIVYSQLPAVQYGDKLVTIKEQAVLQMPLFKASDFASFIAKETIVGYENDPVRIDNIDLLTFAYESATTSQSVLANEDNLRFKIVGVPKIVWVVDEGKLALDLVNKEKTAIPQILKSYTGIEKSEVKIRPIWKRGMPDNHEDITITEQIGEN